MEEDDRGGRRWKEVEGGGYDRMIEDDRNIEDNIG